MFRRDGACVPLRVNALGLRLVRMIYNVAPCGLPGLLFGDSLYSPRDEVGVMYVVGQVFM